MVDFSYYLAVLQHKIMFTTSTYDLELVELLPLSVANELSLNTKIHVQCRLNYNNESTTINT